MTIEDPHPNLFPDQVRALRRWLILFACALGGMVLPFLIFPIMM